MRAEQTTIETSSGVVFDFAKIGTSEMRIEDIAHSLGNNCRFGGHVNKFYSVAEHSVHVASMLPDKYKLWGLLHDASEGYMLDLPRPLKYMLPKYLKIESKLQTAIYSKFAEGAPNATAYKVIKHADNAMLIRESGTLLTTGSECMSWTKVKPAKVVISCWSPKTATNMFMKEWRKLTRR